MESFWELFKQKDKWLHLTAGFLISTAVGSLLWCVNSIIAGCVGTVCGSVAGIAKEIWDSKGHGTADKWDAVFTTLGAVIGFFAGTIIHHCIWY